MPSLIEEGCEKFQRNENYGRKRHHGDPLNSSTDQKRNMCQKVRLVGKTRGGGGTGFGFDREEMSRQGPNLDRGGAKLFFGI